MKEKLKKVTDFLAKNEYRIYALLICVILLTLVLSSSFLPVNKRNKETSYSQEYKDFALVDGYIVDDKGGFFVNSSSPKICINLSGEKINDIEVKLASKVKSSGEIQVFYSTDGSFVEQNSVKKQINKGETELFVTIPEGNYTAVRVDISCDFDMYGIYASYVTSNQAYVGRYVNVVPLVFLILVIAICILCVTVFKKQCKTVFATIKEKYFSNEVGITCEKANIRKTANLFALFALVFGVIIIYLCPPFVVPDENAHFINLCKIYHGDLFQSVENGQAGVYMSSAEIDFLNTLGGKYNGLSSSKFSFSELDSIMSIKQTSAMRFFQTDFGGLNFIPYIVPSIVLFIAKLFFGSISPYGILIIAKIANLIFSVIVIRLAIIKTGALKNTMFLLALMPMTIFQCASTSYDATLIPMSFLLFAYVTKIMFSSEDYTVTNEDIVAICISCFFIIGTKVAYAPLVLIFLSFSIKKFKNIKRYFTCVGLIVGVFIVAYLIPMFVNSIIAKDVVANTLTSQMAIEQSEYFKSHIFGLTPRILIDTTKTLKLFWAEGFFGILGWLDTRFPSVFVCIFLALLAISAILEISSTKNVNFRARLFSLLSIFIFFAGSILVAYLQWNPTLQIVGGTVAYGMQGRYFIPVFAFAFIAIANPILSKFKYNKKINDTECVVTKAISLVYLCLTAVILLTRYW